MALGLGDREEGLPGSGQKMTGLFPHAQYLLASGW